MKSIFDKLYDGESICDVQRDITECFDERYNPLTSDIPVDEHGFQTGTFRIQVTWVPDNEDS